jgi:hypothetical protein
MANPFSFYYILAFSSLLVAPSFGARFAIQFLGSSWFDSLDENWNLPFWCLCALVVFFSQLVQEQASPLRHHVDLLCRHAGPHSVDPDQLSSRYFFLS